MNMQEIKRSRHNPKRGDIFRLRILADLYHWGRVVSTTARVGGFDNCVLVYLYSPTTTGSQGVPSLRASDLLIAPVATNRRPWTMGFFEHVDNTDIAEGEMLDVHCFRQALTGRFFDENGNRLERRYEPCGDFGLDSFRSIDDKLSVALQIPLAEDSEME